MESRQLVSFDWAIKHILRNKADYRVLNGFLSELFRKDVVVQAVLESSSNANSVDDKTNSVDVKVSINGGEIVIVEIQFLDEYDFFQRINFGTSKAVSEQIHKGEDYGKIKKVYSVDIVYFDLGSGTDYVYRGKTEFKGLHSDDVLQLTQTQKDLFGINFVSDIFPEYYLINVAKYKNELKDKLDEWIYYFKNDEVKDSFSAQGLDIAATDLEYLKLSREDKIAYDRKMDQERQARSIVKTAAIKEERMKKLDAAIVQNKAELAQKETEIAQKDVVIAQKETELAKKESEIVEAKKQAETMFIETVRKLKSKGMTVEDIADITGFPIAEVERV